MSLIVRERPGRGEPHGLLVLHHGRGSDERDLLTLADVLDPQQRLHVVTPRAPLAPTGAPAAAHEAGGYHWYVVERVGVPDPRTFAHGYAALAELHDELWQRTGIGPERTVLGGFSQGTVMSYALGLGAGRPRPAGVLAFAGFIPTVPGWEPDLASRSGLPVLIAHGARDGVIEVGFGRSAAEQLTDGGLAVEYHESAAAHHIDPRVLPAAADWLARTLAAADAAGARDGPASAS
jgi:phospholipase/carboxylesterase